MSEYIDKEYSEIHKRTGELLASMIKRNQQDKAAALEAEIAAARDVAYNGIMKKYTGLNASEIIANSAKKTMVKEINKQIANL